MTYPPDPYSATSVPGGHLLPGVVAQQQRDAHDALEDDQYSVHDQQWQVFHRLRLLSVNHAQKGYRLRYRTPLSAHALAFLFVQPATAERAGGRRSEVVAATRLWLAGPESRHAGPLLAELTRQARERDPRSVWDLREHLANRCDTAMGEHAVYLGLGLSSLDTAAGRFAQVCQTASTELEVGGSILYVATGSAEPEDQQIIAAERHGAGTFNATTIHSYRALSLYRLSAPYPFAEAGLHALYGDPVRGPLLEGMRLLDFTLRQADAERRAMQNGPRARRGRP
ncbi:hypothetical protein OWR29_39150 [Actinoplanes sp. Pm04-4]|uniref:Uncharacterized protein n=1 Tax=Paractinoplanes pyxinae TaxID=2997416 RepID=A0ABT4BBZ7_9ACTN|nr:hypothetical protein [Actinoplanes pyxinae]MCY1144049.1 hypothetical protein [Actinoplanes pyxinae]